MRQILPIVARRVDAILGNAAAERIPIFSVTALVS